VEPTTVQVPHIGRSIRRGHNRRIEFRVILLHICRAILLSKFLDHRFHSLGSGDWLCPELLLQTSRLDANLWLKLLSASVQAFGLAPVKGSTGLR
jgi:hypothetical protein